MSTDIDLELKAFADRLDRAMPAVSADEVRSAALDRRDGQSAGSGRRLALVAATALVIGAGTVAIVVARGSDDGTTRSPSGTLAPPDADPDIGRRLPVQADTVVPTIEPPATVVAPEESAATTPTPALTVADVQAAQVEALRRLPGFSATVSRNVVAPDGTESVEDRSYALLADGSFYTESGPGLFGSYDATSGVVSGAFLDPAGALTYQQIVGQADNSLPLLMLTGYDPTQIVYGVPTSDSQQTVEVVDYDGRPAWQVTTTYVFEKSPDFESVGGPPPPDFTQVTTQTVDPATGLVVAYSVTSTDEQMQEIDARLHDVEVIEAMPDGFPGAIPADAHVDVSGDPNGFRTVTREEVAATFGIPTPVPVLASIASTTLVEQPTSYGMPASSITDDSMPSDSAPTDVTGVSRQARFTTREGFVKSTVTISTQTVDEGQQLPAGMAVDDGFLCGDSDLDQTCDQPYLAGNADSFQISSGALAGQLAVVYATSIETSLSPFRISIQGHDLDAVRAIAGSFELVIPS